VIRLQEELKFHFYYTGVDPEDGKSDPRQWLCLVVYDKRNWPGIARGLLGLRIDLSSSAEEQVSKDSEDLAIQMMLRSSDAWVTFCDPWLKKPISAPEGAFRPGTVYHHKDHDLQSMGL
ncbi:unnamed protein product, partial [Polarella glacialis]